MRNLARRCVPSLRYVAPHVESAIALNRPFSRTMLGGSPEIARRDKIKNALPSSSELVLFISMPPSDFHLVSRE
jgi:hypothetical protein